MIYDLTEIAESLPKITSAIVLLNVFMQMTDETNCVKIKKQELASALEKSRRTISEWIIMLCKSGAIKYKYSGLTCVNPAIFYKGTAQGLKLAQDKWKEFKSDIKAQ